MKTLRLFRCLLIGMIALITLSCGSSRKSKTVRFPGTTSSRTSTHLPPGHAKKLYGHQSARAFAPGQQKKAVNKKATPSKAKKGKSKKAKAK